MRVRVRSRQRMAAPGARTGEMGSVDEGGGLQALGTTTPKLRPVHSADVVRSWPKLRMRGWGCRILQVVPRRVLRQEPATDHLAMENQW